jgi:hypothetical protein
LCRRLGGLGAVLTGKPVLPATEDSKPVASHTNYAITTVRETS